MATIGDRLRQERKDRGLTQEAVAALAGISKQGVSAIERGETGEPEAATLEPICRAWGLSLRWLLTGKGAKDAAEPESEADWKDVLGWKQGVALGDGAALDEYALAHKLKFRASSLRRKGLFPKNLAVYYGSGDSMEPRIRDGDAVLFDMSDTRLKDDGVFVVEYRGDLYAKRMQKIGDGWFMTSDNRDDPKWRKPIPVTLGDGFKPIGRVRWIGSWED